MELQLLVGAVVLLVAIGAARLGSGLGLPSLLLFLGLGVLLGDAGLGVRFSDAALAHNLGFAALVLILAEGGLTTSWRDIRPALGVAGLLATVGVVVSIALVAVFVHYVLVLPWALSVLLGAVLSPTDSAAVFSVLRRVPLPKRLTSTLEGESGLNDAPTVILVTVATAMAMSEGPEGGIWGTAGLVAFELVGGIAVGLAVGVLGTLMLRSIALPSSGLYPLAVIAWCVTAYGLGWWLHTSGFAAVYVCALLMGNAALPHRRAMVSFVEGVGWIAQIGLFIMLGLLATPARLTWRSLVVAIAVGLFLTFVARPLAVIVCATPFRMPWREQVFLSWAGLRGAVPIILTTIPMAAGLPNNTTLFDVVFLFVVLFTLLQGPTLPALAKLLGLGGSTLATLEVEAAPLERIDAELMHTQVPDDSRLRGVTIQELRLPKDVVVSLIIRAGEAFAPQASDVIRGGDELLIVAPGLTRLTVEERLQDVASQGRIANWRRREVPTPPAPKRWRRGAGAGAETGGGGSS